MPQDPGREWLLHCVIHSLLQELTPACVHTRALTHDCLVPSRPMLTFPFSQTSYAFYTVHDRHIDVADADGVLSLTQHGKTLLPVACLEGFKSLLLQ